MEKAIRFIVFMGLVSLFADMSYEGARSISGAFLATLGVSAVLLGFFIGLGEFLCYVLRIPFGYMADKFSSHWLFTFFGYILIFSIPLIAFAESWEIVVALLILERIGKALRTPARDTIISFATSRIGTGKAFGLHEALDQIGAVLGPLMIFLILHTGYGYEEGYLILFFPSFFAIIFLYLAKREFGFEVSERIVVIKGSFNFYLLFTLFSIAGLANFQLIAFHLETGAIFEREMIPILYAMAMGSDAISALLSGRMYDRFGFSTLLAIPLLTPLSVALSFSLSPALGIFLFGIILGMQESVMRAAVASISAAEKRATAYGVFNTVMGLGFLLSGIAFGVLYPNPQLMILYSILCEILAVAFLIKAVKTRNQLNGAAEI